MHKSGWIFCLISIVLMSSCGFQEKHEALEFYNKLISINDSLDKMTTEWHAIRDQASVSKNYSALNPYRISLGSFIARNRSIVANIPATADMEKIKNDEDALLSTQSALVSDVYPNFEQFNEYTPQEVMAKNITLLGDDLLNVKSKVASLKKSLLVYSDKHKLKK